MHNFKDLLQDFYNNKLDNGMFTTTNESGNNVIVTITNDYLKTSTTQDNGWIRVNTYYNDKEHTKEESYER